MEIDHCIVVAFFLQGRACQCWVNVRRWTRLYTRQEGLLTRHPLRGRVTRWRRQPADHTASNNVTLKPIVLTLAFKSNTVDESVGTIFEGGDAPRDQLESPHALITPSSSRAPAEVARPVMKGLRSSGAGCALGQSCPNRSYPRTSVKSGARGVRQLVRTSSNLTLAWA